MATQICRNRGEREETLYQQITLLKRRETIRQRRISNNTIVVGACRGIRLMGFFVLMHGSNEFLESACLSLFDKHRPRGHCRLTASATFRRDVDTKLYQSTWNLLQSQATSTIEIVKPRCVHQDKSTKVLAMLECYQSSKAIPVRTMTGNARFFFSAHGVSTVFEFVTGKDHCLYACILEDYDGVHPQDSERFEDYTRRISPLAMFPGLALVHCMIYDGRGRGDEEDVGWEESVAVDTEPCRDETRCCGVVMSIFKSIPELHANLHPEYKQKTFGHVVPKS